MTFRTRRYWPFLGALFLLASISVPMAATYTFGVSGTATSSGGTTTCTVGGTTTEAVPAIASTLGLTTCAFTMDPTLSYWQTQSNWLDPTNKDFRGINGPPWHCWNDSLPCQFPVVDDPVYHIPAFDVAFLQSSTAVGTIQINTISQDTIWNGGQSWLSFPKTALFEVEFRQNNHTGVYGTTNYLGPIGWDLYTVNPTKLDNSNSSLLESTFGEIGNDTGGYSGGCNLWVYAYCSYTNGTGLSGGGSDVNTSYLQEWQLTSCPASTGGSTGHYTNDCYQCWWIGLGHGVTPVFVTCAAQMLNLLNASNSNQIYLYSDRLNLNYQDAFQGSSVPRTLLNDHHTYINHARVWSCAAALQGVPDLPIDDSHLSQPYNCAAGRNTLYGPDGNGLVYWH